jgi:site-specific recombinase XerC
MTTPAHAPTSTGTPLPASTLFAVARPLEPVVRASATSCPARAYVAGLGSPASRRVISGDLDRIAGLLSGGRLAAAVFPWERLTHEHTSAARAVLLRVYAKTTARRMVAALRGALRKAWLLGLMDGDTYQRAAALEPIRATRLPRGREITRGEVAALFGMFAHDQPQCRGARDAALLVVMYPGGLRRSEAAGLDIKDWDAGSRSLTVRGKGDRERVVFVDSGAGAAITEWLTHRSSDAGPLFTPVGKNGRVTVRRLSSSAIYQIVRRWEQRCPGLLKATPHDFRRSTATHLLEASVDLLLVADQLGHASAETTRLYDRREDRARADALARLHTPYTQPLRGSDLSASPSAR